MLTTDAVASIKACSGVYRAADVARHYGVHRSNVSRIWRGQQHSDIRPAPDFPDIATPLRGRDLYDATKTLLLRGYTVAEVMEELGVSQAYVYAVKGVFN